MTIESRAAPRESVQAVRRRAQQAYASNVRERDNHERIVAHLWLVKHIAQRLAVNLPKHISFDEMYSAGTLGLVTAARDYDVTRKIEFSTYAYRRIRGAMLDDLRARSFVSPNVHARIRQARAAYDRAASAAGGTPEDAEVAREAGMTLSEYYRTLDEARRQSFLSVHGFVEDQPALENLLPTSRERDPAKAAERVEEEARLADAIRELPEKERQVIILYYMKDLNMKEIGATLNVNESRVSQLHSSALFRLSIKMRRGR